MSEEIIVHRIKNLIAKNGVNSDNFAEEIYSNRKSLGLYTLDDIEIDKKKVEKVLEGEINHLDEIYAIDFICNAKEDFPNKHPEFALMDDLAKAIVNAKPIKIREK